MRGVRRPEQELLRQELVTLERTVVAALATYRLARIIPEDDVAEPLRRALERWALAGGGEGGGARAKTAQLLTCTMCGGFWIALLVVLAQRRGGRWGRIAVGWWAAAGLQVIVQQAMAYQVRDELTPAEQEAWQQWAEGSEGLEAGEAVQ